MRRPAAVYCDRCGAAVTPLTPHDCPSGTGALPPRFCGACGQPMDVHVDAHGWTARCNVHGMRVAH